MSGRVKAAMASIRGRALSSSMVLAAATTSSAVLLGATPGLGIIPGAVAMGVGALGIGATLFTASSRAAEAQPRRLSLPQLDAGISEEMKLKIEELYELALIYEERRSPLFPAVSGVLSNVLELFGRLSTQTDQQSARIAAVRYVDTLTKLNTALGKSYYLDIEAHPELWSSPDERMEAVEAAVNATGEELLRNIRQLNSSRDLVYELSIESLTGVKAAHEDSKALGLSASAASE